MKVQCPLCFLKFPINEVEQHADGCSASFGLLAENDVACDIPTFEDLGDESSIVEQSRTDTLNNCISTLKDNGINSDMDSVRVP